MKSSNKTLIKIFIIILIFYRYLLADAQKEKLYKNLKSQCTVKSTASIYPNFTVYKKGKIIFDPVSDGIYDVVFSPTGKYIALLSNEISGIDVEKNKFEFSMAIINCETGKIKGYIPANCPSLKNQLACMNTIKISKWDEKNSKMEYVYIPGFTQSKDKQNKILDFKIDLLP